MLDLLRDGARLLTLTGPGGTGKSRLALQAGAEAADDYPDGVWWVSMAPLRDARLVVSALAQPLQVEEQPGRELVESVAERLDGTRSLLLLDNAEHLLPDVASEIAALRDVRGPKILVTSRERLQLQGEHVYAVPTMGEADSVELFMTRGRALGATIDASDTVVEVCARLDNLPLAIELAAARTVVFSPEKLLERLGERLDLLRAGRDADPRQQTLRATIEWSYDLLDDAERRLFRAFSVFANGCTFESAEQVCGADAATLQSLLDKSLVRPREGERYWMLETVRELAAEKLASEGETAAVRRRHAEHYLALALSANLSADALGPQLHRIVLPERDNLRAAVAWAAENGERELGLELVVALENYWATNSPHEGAEWAERLLEGATGVPERLVVRALRVQGGMVNAMGDFEAAAELWSRALPIARRIGDEQAVAILLHRFANAAMGRGDVEQARSFAEESLAGHRRAGFRKGETQALTALADVARAQGDLERALELLEESRGISEEVGFLWWLSGNLAGIAAVSLGLGRLDDAEARAREALAHSRAMNDRAGIVYELELLAEISARRGDRLRAGTLRGARDAELERAPAGPWVHGRFAIERASLPPHEDFERGCEMGRELSLQDAVAVALGERT